MDALDELERGRKCYERRAWADAYESLSRADQAAPLGGEDLELLAMAAYLIGRDDDYLQALDRAHHAHLDAGERLRAVRCAFWLGFVFLFRGETGRATGWFAPRPAVAGARGARVRRAGLSVVAGRGAAPCRRRLRGRVRDRG